MTRQAAPGTTDVNLLAPDSDELLAERIAAVVTAHPAVARLDSGVFGAVATYLPGRRLAGVRLGTRGEPVEIGVVVRLGAALPGVVAALRREVSAICDGARVDITVTDLDIAAAEVGPPATRDP